MEKKHKNPPVNLLPSGETVHVIDFYSANTEIQNLIGIYSATVFLESCYA